MQIRQHLGQPHNGQLGQILVELTAGGSHLGTTVANGPEMVQSGTELTNQICSVQVPARFPNGEENIHRSCGKTEAVQPNDVWCRKWETNTVPPGRGGLAEYCRMITSEKEQSEVSHHFRLPAYFSGFWRNKSGQFLQQK